MLPFKFREMLDHIAGVVHIEVPAAHVAIGKIDYEIHQKGTMLFEFC